LEAARKGLEAAKSRLEAEARRMEEEAARQREELQRRERGLVEARAEGGRLRGALEDSRRREESLARQLLSLDIFKLDVIAREMKQVPRPPSSPAGAPLHRVGSGLKTSGEKRV